mgnify:CR=1 FL=1
MGGRSSVSEIPLTTFIPPPASLGVINSNQLPFEVQRTYWLVSREGAFSRGFHAHRSLQQVMFCLNGSATLSVHSRDRMETFELVEGGAGIHLRGGLWREVLFYQPGTVLLVFASEETDENDYIRDFSQFMAWSEHG